jgi:hypothetical protein
VSTVGAIVGQKIAPGLLDIYLGRTGYASQQTNDPISPQRPDNLFASVSGEYAAHGSFDKRAGDRATELWLGIHRAASIGIGVVVMGLVLAGMRRFLQ